MRIQILVAMAENTSPTEPGEPEEIFSYLQEMVDFSMTLVAAKNGNSRAKNDIKEMSKVKGRFPGNRDKAMGHALVIKEDLNELGIPSQREHIRETATGHRIDILIGDSEA